MEEELGNFSSCHVLLMMLEIMQIKLMSTASSERAGKERLNIKNTHGGPGRSGGRLGVRPSGVLASPLLPVVSGRVVGRGQSVSHHPQPSHLSHPGNLVQQQNQRWVLGIAPNITPVSQLIKTPEHEEQRPAAPPSSPAALSVVRTSAVNICE